MPRLEVRVNPSHGAEVEVDSYLFPSTGTTVFLDESDIAPLQASPPFAALLTDGAYDTGSTSTLQLLENGGALIAQGSALRWLSKAHLYDLYRQRFANATERTTDSTTYTADDLYSLAIQEDTDQVYWLTAITPTWDPVTADPASGSGEANTASNVGSGGVGVYKQKTGVNLELRNIAAGSSKVSVTLDAGNNEVDIDVAEGNIGHDNLSGFVANEHIDHSTIDISTTEGIQGGGTIAADRSLKLDINGLTADASPDGAADYLATYDASAGVHKRVLLDNLPGGGGVFGTEWTYHEKITNQTTTSTNWVNYTSKTTGTLPAGDYLIIVSVGFRATANGTVCEWRAQVDNTTNLIDPDFTGYYSQTAEGAATSSVDVSGVCRRVTLTNATHTIDVDFRRQSTGALHFRYAYISLYRVA